MSVGTAFAAFWSAREALIETVPMGIEKSAREYEVTRNATETM